MKRYSTLKSKNIFLAMLKSFSFFSRENKKKNIGIVGFKLRGPKTTAKHKNSIYDWNRTQKWKVYYEPFYDQTCQHEMIWKKAMWNWANYLLLM